MTPKQALGYWIFRYDMTKDFADIHREADERREHEEYVETLQKAVEAIKKQIPKKAKYMPKKEGYITINYECPSCGCRRLLGYTKVIAYCLGCGQAIDWSENNA